MNKALAFTLMSALLIGARVGSAAQNQVTKQNQPECSEGAICFSGELSAGHEFHKVLNNELELVLEPSKVLDEFQPQGWTIEVVPRLKAGRCQEFASVVNGPYRQHTELYVDTSYGVTAEEEVANSPRDFGFVTNCNDYSTEADRLEKVLWPYMFTEQEVNRAMAELGTSPLGKGRLWITGSRISHAAGTPDNKLGKIEWMQFAVEIRLPDTRPSSPAQTIQPQPGHAPNKRP